MLYRFSGVFADLVTFCQHCGNAIRDGVEQCTHCGARLNNGASSLSPLPPSDPANQLPPTTPEELLTQAMKLADQEAYDDAILFCRRAIHLKPDFAPAYAFLGEMYERVGEWTKALDAFEKALALDKNYEPAKLGKERLLKSPPPQPAEATVAEMKSRWIGAGHPLPLLGATALVVGLLFAVRMVVPPVPKGAPTVSPPPITLAPSLHPPTPPATVPPMPAPVKAAIKRGMEALNANKHDEAIRWFERALELDPNNNEAHSWLLIARAMKEEAQQRPTSPIIAARPTPAPLPVLPRPSPQAHEASKEPSAPTSRSSPERTSPVPQQWRSQQPPQSQPPQPSSTPPWGWQPQWTPPIPMMPQGVPANPPTIPTQPANPTTVPVPTREQPSAPASSQVPTIPPPPPSPEELERQAAQKIYEGDLTGAVELYRALLARGVSVDREGYIRQQLALALQQLSRYGEGADEYERAIAAYRRQIERGINVPAAQRGIDACQRGLEICRRMATR